MKFSPRVLACLLLQGCLSLPLLAGSPPTPEGTADPPGPSSFPGDGPGGEILSLSLEEAIQRAQAASPRLDQLRDLRDGAEAGLKGTRAERLPQVDLSAGYARYSDVPVLAIEQPPPGGSTILFPNLPDNYAARVAMTLPLYTGGRLSSLITAADREREAAGKDVEAGGQDLVLETSATYWSLVTALEAEKVLGESMAAYDAHLQDATRREKFGMAAKNEVLAVQVERDRAELARLRAVNSAEVLRADLARLLGLSREVRVEPSATLAPLGAPGEDLAALLQEARSSRPDRAALMARIDAADARTRAARADRLPQARFSAGYDYASPNRRILPYSSQWQDFWEASVGLSFRVFDGGRTAASVAQGSAQAEAVRSQLEDLDRKIEFEVTRRLLELQTAAAAVEVTERSLESARENRRVASDRYRAGLIPSSELLDAELAMLRASLERTESLARQRLALSALQRAVGR
jgi:outer membrane protein TolC